MRTSDHLTRGLRFVVAAVAALAAAAPARARAADNLPPAIAGAGGPARGGPGLWQLAGGFRLARVRDAGFDPFASNDVLPQVSLAATRALAPPRSTGFIPAVGLGWEEGGSSEQARGSAARLLVKRLGVVLEGRYAPVRRLYLVLRLVPAAQWTLVSLQDSSAPATLGAHYRNYSVDGSLGAAARLTPEASPLGFWILADAGYGWAQRQDLVLRPALPAPDANKAGATSLGSLDTQGAFMRVWMAISY
jgi:hypothetical protein